MGTTVEPCLDGSKCEDGRRFGQVGHFEAKTLLRLRPSEKKGKPAEIMRS